MAFASPKMVTQFLYLDDNVIDVNFEILKCRSQEYTPVEDNKGIKNRVANDCKTESWQDCRGSW